MVVRDGALQPRTVYLTIGDIVLDQRTDIHFELYHDTNIRSRASRIRIYNIGDRRESIIASAGAPYRVEAGFGDSYGVLCSGFIDIVNDDWQDAESTMDILLRGHEVSRFQVLEWRGATLRAALRELAVSSGLHLDPLPENTVFNEQIDRAYSGSVQKILDDLAEEYRLTMALVCDRIIVVPDGLQQEPTAVISEARGMLGRPTRTENGFKAQMHIDSSKYPLQVVTLSSRLFAGDYRLESVKHIGDTRGQDYYTEVRGVTL